MRLHENDRGQIYTIEGIVASLIILSILIFIIQSNSIIVPQTERSIDMKLYERASDVLTCLDMNGNDTWSPMLPLKTYVIGWEGSEGDITGTGPDMAGLDNNISAMLPDHVQYGLDFIYYDWSGDRQDKHVIVHGTPGDNSVVATRFVTLNYGEVPGDSYWRTHVYTHEDDFPHIVELKLMCWYL